MAMLIDKNIAVRNKKMNVAISQCVATQRYRTAFYHILTREIDPWMVAAGPGTHGNEVNNFHLGKSLFTVLKNQ